jgi:hypothetical protein
MALANNKSLKLTIGATRNVNQRRDKTKAKRERTKGQTKL